MRANRILNQLPISRRSRGFISVLITLIIVIYAVRQDDAESKPSSQNLNISAAPAEAPVVTEGVVGVRAVDGDTLDVLVDGKPMRVRVIGINTPESVDPRRPVQCFGKEASARAGELLGRKKVTLSTDPTQDDADKYGRKLRYVEIEGEGDFGLKMISEGFAHEYTYEKPHAKRDEYRKAQDTAQRTKQGLWSPDTCNGDTEKPAETKPEDGPT